ncbi:replication initiation protein [Maribacter polysaccharolyticus]|uniref:replication initiation protein n=1 Tax=Maribacter polysaccharolyticus TaxID=3020831 RepID=UPI00237F00A6|nr:replication initiation protein [Maribacter polysaccharolyticus]MDE3744021.1 replication initiation protein [Maribacter polysaccharolyticus]
MSKEKQLQVYNPKTAPKNINQPYSLTRQLQSFDYSIHELRIVFRILEMIKKHQFTDQGAQLELDNRVQFQYPVSAFMVDGHKNHDKVREAIKNLRDKSIAQDVVMEIYEKGVKKSIPGEKFSALIEDPIYAKNNSYVQFHISSDWFHFLTDLVHGYTPYVSNIAFQCSRLETVKFYQFISHWFKQGGRTLKMNSFKKEFGIPKTYNVSKIESRILRPIKQELDRLSDKSFNYTILYTDGTARDPQRPIRGKTVDKITISFYQNHKNTKTYSLDSFEHKETNKWLLKIKPRYKLTEEEKVMLYGTIRYHGYLYVSNLEVDNRKSLKKFEGREFLDALNKIIRKEKTERGNKGF